MTTTHEDKERILKTVKKLLEFTSKNNCTQGEIENAAAKVRALLERHNLSMYDVTAHTFSESISEITKETKFRRMPKGVGIFAQYIARCFDCKVFLYERGRDSKPKVAFVGYSTDAETASYFFDTILPQLLNMARKELTLARKLKGNLGYKNYRNSYLYGAGVSIHERLKKQNEAEQSSTGKEIVLAKDKAIVKYLEKFHLRARGRGVNVDQEGYHSGLRAGKSVSLTRGIHAQYSDNGQKLLR